MNIFKSSNDDALNFHKKFRQHFGKFALKPWLGISSFALLLGCMPTNSISYSGAIDGKFLSFLETNNAQDKTLNLSSNGGRTDVAYLAAKNIYTNNNPILIRGECISACAEYILPAANSVVFKDNPIVGFHWNSLMNRSHILRYGGNISQCSDDTIDQLKEVYGFKNLSIDFWRETEKRLVLKSYSVVPKPPGCPWKRREFENRVWLATSLQLTNLWGLDFSGSVCADDITNCLKKVNRRWEKGARIIIGDEVYVSKGR